jgi:glycyl-tRNA synthetase
MSDKENLMEKIVSLAKRRGFIYPGSEIYGGLANTWDYGPLGVELKNNVKKVWWRDVVWMRDDVVGLDASILMNRKVWQASGHEKGFTDPLIECKKCHHRFREDHIEGECPDCGNKEFTEGKMFNLMFRTHAGPLEDDSNLVYLRPETAQGIFVNFDNVVKTSRMKVPFGIGQVGKSFRNEITPGNFIFRTREFEQIELEYFVKPGEDKKWFEYWVNARFEWYQKYGLRKENLRLREHGKDELAHYAIAAKDVEYKFPFGWSELEGIANRTDFDLKQHSEHSGEDLSYFDDETKERYIPYVIEPSGGVDRSVLAFLVDAYYEEEVKGETRVSLKFHRDLAPIKVAVLPLVKKDEKLVAKAKEVYGMIRGQFASVYDEVDSVGRRYRRQDEAGTPYCVTVDGQTLEDSTVTVRERDTMSQERVSIDELMGYLNSKF